MLVTGGANSIGRGIVDAFLSEGASGASTPMYYRCACFRAVPVPPTAVLLCASRCPGPCRTCCRLDNSDAAAAAATCTVWCWRLMLMVLRVHQLVFSLAAQHNERTVLVMQALARSSNTVVDTGEVDSID